MFHEFLLGGKIGESKQLGCHGSAWKLSFIAERKLKC
jgi:hypothetical protein